MKTKFIEYLLLLLLVLVGDFVTAQEIDYDYTIYKFYKEEADEVIVVLDVDSLSQPTMRAGFMPSIASNAEYALRTLSQNSEIGAGYFLHNFELDYHTARMLRQLGVQRKSRHSLCDVGGGEALLTLEDYMLGTQRRERFAGHYLRAEFSGRGYLAGISHKATHTPMRNGVLLANDWTITHYARVRTGRDLYVEGVYGNMVDLAAEASWSDRRNALSLVVMMPWTERGLRSGSVDEAFGLVGNNHYNPLWGMQRGKVRNSRVATMLRPEAVAVWDRRLSVSTTMRLTLDAAYDNYASTSLAWFNAPTPMPDNYHYLPSYFNDFDDGVKALEAWRDNDLRYTQIDWDGLYHTNMLQSDGHARYAVERRVRRDMSTSLLANFLTHLKGVDVEYGVAFTGTTSRYFKVMDDLLGARHIVDRDYYLVDDATHANRLQNNLLHPDRVIVEGDRFGYDYRLSRYGTSFYGRADLQRGDMVFGVEARVSAEHTRRRGYYEKELFPGRGSYGRSQSVMTTPYRLAVSWGYNISQHCVGAAVMVEGRSAEVENMFLQPQYNNRVVMRSALSTNIVARASYIFVPSSKIKTQVVLYVVNRRNESDLFCCYDDLSGCYSNVVISGIGRLAMGVDLRAEVGWNRYLSSDFRFLASRNRYCSDADVEIYADADNRPIATTRSMIRGCRVGVPELAAYGDLSFNYSGWHARASVAWCGVRCVAPSLLRRTERVLSFAASSEECQLLEFQRRLPSATSVDLSISKRFKFEDLFSLNVQFSVRNILNSGGVYGAYEQSRLRRIKDGNAIHLEPFADKLTFAYPRTFYLAVSLWF